jgi:hypothetical protein
MYQIRNIIRNIITMNEKKNDFINLLMVQKKDNEAEKRNENVITICKRTRYIWK